MWDWIHQLLSTLEDYYCPLASAEPGPLTLHPPPPGRKSRIEMHGKMGVSGFPL